ncbi:MAG: SLC13 family permease, partial [Oscillospiraceae bacterium]|nr:SLC13 family permease [Oscillospiraceae bacterium]
NDVALIAFVPLTAGIFRIYGREGLISTVVLETIAANVGSMLTPVGNPQNLYLFSFYHLGLSRFLLIVLPTVAVGYVLLMGILLVSKNSQVEVRATRRVSFGQRKSLFFCVAGSFILCVLAVLRAVDYRICVPAVLLCLLLADRKLYKKADYGLLLTFVAFFIFAGNIEQLPAVKDALAGLLAGRAFPVSLLGSQVVSNVPAAMMAARFTDDTRGVLLGVNIGGLGTPVASLASLIAFRLYAKSENAAPRRYWGVFTVYNVIFLAVLAGAAVLLG